MNQRASTPSEPVAVPTCTISLEVGQPPRWGIECVNERIVDGCEPGTESGTQAYGIVITTGPLLLLWTGFTSPIRHGSPLPRSVAQV